MGSETVEAVRTRHTDTPIRTGDVTHLAVPDGYCSGYVSLGVVEHHRKGPEPIARGLPGISAWGNCSHFCAYCHALRRLKAKAGLYKPQIKGMQFYQYVFSIAEFTSIPLAADFNVCNYMLYDIPKGIRDEITVLRWVFGVRGIGWRLQHLLQSWRG